MSDTTELKRQLVDLQFLGDLLADSGIPYHLTEQSADFELPFLSVEVGVPEAPVTTYLQMMYIPTSALLEETNLLQFFAYLPPVDGPQQKITSHLIDFLNTRTPIGYFGHDEAGQLFYRYVYAIPRFEVPNKANFLAVLDLYSGTMSTIGARLLEVLRGENDEATMKKSI